MGGCIQCDTDYLALVEGISLCVLLLLELLYEIIKLLSLSLFLPKGVISGGVLGLEGAGAEEGRLPYVHLLQAEQRLLTAQLKPRNNGSR